jgi:hypothetical protein
MQKWIQYVEKLLRHSDYIEIITQIYGSNNLLSDFKQMYPKNIINKEYLNQDLQKCSNEKLA